MSERLIGQKSPTYETAELGRAIPRLLDSRRVDGGVLRLLTEPGGRVDAQSLRAVDATQAVSTVPAVALERLKLLIQGPAELDEDFMVRASISPFRSAYWAAIEHLASRPFDQGVGIKGNAPTELQGASGDKPGGEWFENIDGNGTDLPSFLSGHARSAVGYGYGAILTERKGDRGVWRWAEAESITYVEAMNRQLPGPSAVEIAGFENGQPVILRLLSAERSGGRWAEAHVHEKRAGSSGFSQEPSQVRQLDPHVEIPLDPIPAQILTPEWWALPLLLPAAKLDHLLVNVSSSTAYSVLQTLTFLRFASGLSEEEIKQMRKVGPRVFYASSKPDADMKWVTVPADAVKAGTDYEDHILRGIEVAGLAPMLTRMPGDEKATGIAVSTSRARSAAESIARMMQSGASSAYTRLARYTPSAPDLALQLRTDMGISESARHAGELRSRVYLDPKAGMSRPEFWAAMIEEGIVDDSVDVADLTRWADQANPEQAKLRLQRAQLAMAAAESGFLDGDTGRAALYRSMIEAGSIRPPDGADPEQWVAALVAESSSTRREE